MWEPFPLSLQEHVPHARLVYDKFQVPRHAGEAVDETRRAEFFRQGRAARSVAIIDGVPGVRPAARGRPSRTWA